MELIPTALPKFVNAQDSNPPSPRPSPPLSRGERAGNGGILHAQEFVNSGSAIGITYQRVHSGYGMAGRTPYGCCVALGFSGSGYVGLMPVVLLLDNIVLERSRQACQLSTMC
jgi:hypothetical protein